MSSLTVEQVMDLAPVIPVLVVERVEDALPIAQALVKGGLPALEVTLRTPAALDVIREMAKVEGAVVGAGTVLNPAQLDAAMEAGARFIVSPGLAEPLGKAAFAAGIPFLPGTATAGDIMRGRNLRRPAGAQGLGGAAPHRPLLPHRRHHRPERARMAGAALHQVRRRQLGRAQGGGRPCQDRGAGAGSGGAAALRRLRRPGGPPRCIA